MQGTTVVTTQDCQQEVIQHKITKVNGQIAYKRYLKGKMLGKGGFAKCYEGFNLESQKRYAIKVVEKSGLSRNRAKQKLLSEIKIHKTLHHRHIVEFDSVFEDSKNVYIILELCTNKTLSEMVKKRKKLSPREVRYFMAQLLSGLQYMHNCKVIHRDLKMGNIFLDVNMEMKIGDFGLAAKLQFSQQKKRTMCGTPNYIAPEIVEGQVGHSYEVDIWSTGVICYAMLYGRPPFQTSDVKTTYKRIKNCQYTFPKDNVPEEALDFIRKILVLDPKKRPSVAQMLAHPFINSSDIPKSLPISALTQIPVFSSKDLKKNDDQNEGHQVLPPISSRLRPQDFGRNRVSEQNVLKGSQNGFSQANSKKTISPIFQGMLSPRNMFNQPQVLNNQNTSNQNNSKSLNIAAYVDYSTKYGLGYLVNNNYYGVYFNDSTLMSVDHSKTIVYYMDTPSNKQQKLKSYKIADVPSERDFQKKFMLLEKFIGHLKDQYAKIDKQRKSKGIEVNLQSEGSFIYLKQWLKTRHAIMFRLSNKVFQVEFFDGSQILLNTQFKTVKFTGKKGNIIYQTLMGALQAKDSELARRIKYTKQILNSIKKGNADPNQQIENDGQLAQGGVQKRIQIKSELMQQN